MDAESHDAALGKFQSQFQANAGPGIVIPWAQLLAALLSMLGGCLTPTPATVKSQVKRLLPQARLLNRLLASGVPYGQAVKLMNTTVTTVSAATDEDLTAYLAAAESE